MMLDDRLKPYVDLAAEVAVRNSRVYGLTTTDEGGVTEAASMHVVQTVVKLLNNGLRRWQIFNVTSVETLSDMFFKSDTVDGVVVGDWLINSWLEFSARAFSQPSEAVGLLEEIYQHHYALLDKHTVIPENWMSELDDTRELDPKVAGNPWVLFIYLLSIQPSCFIGELLRGRLNERSK